RPKLSDFLAINMYCYVFQRNLHHQTGVIPASPGQAGTGFASRESFLKHRKILEASLREESLRPDKPE
ncbi:MAG: hypothetical protein L0958_05705, partial [Candidatus Mariimomonas ferrooxydans]